MKLEWLQYNGTTNTSIQSLNMGYIIYNERMFSSKLSNYLESRNNIETLNNNKKGD
jgi:hypothetical protein